MQTLSIRIPDETLERLDAIARENQKTVERMVETLLEDFADTDEARLVEYERTGYGIGHETAMAWLSHKKSDGSCSTIRAPKISI